MKIQWGADMIKRANGITLQKDYDLFLIFFHFFVWNNFWMKILQLVIKNTNSYVLNLLLASTIVQWWW
jgi:hypothetical protein